MIIVKGAMPSSSAVQKSSIGKDGLSRIYRKHYDV